MSVIRGIEGGYANICAQKYNPKIKNNNKNTILKKVVNAVKTVKYMAKGKN